MQKFFKRLKSKPKVKGIDFIEYEGFRLNFSKDTSIVERFKRDGSYEPEFIHHLVETLKEQSSGAFLDIGANIGMIALSVLKHCPNIMIYAFEPGPHQFELLQKTLSDNKLSEKIKAYDIALKDETGEATFQIHDSEDVSGDGFSDSQRGGKTYAITVKTEKIDNWWNENGRPEIGTLKIDTEGAELWILKGAHEMIMDQQPVLYLEINDKNIRNYPYEIDDLLRHIKALNYTIDSLDGEAVTSENILSFIKQNDTFIARPIGK